MWVNELGLQVELEGRRYFDFFSTELDEQSLALLDELT